MNAEYIARHFIGKVNTFLKESEENEYSDSGTMTELLEGAVDVIKTLLNRHSAPDGAKGEVAKTIKPLKKEGYIHDPASEEDMDESDRFYFGDAFNVPNRR